MLNFLRKRPNGVIRGSLRFLNTGPDCSFLIRFRIFSASITIVRNLIIQNSLPQSPTRCWKKSGRPLVVTLSTASLAAARETLSRRQLAPVIRWWETNPWTRQPRCEFDDVI